MRVRDALCPSPMRHKGGPATSAGSPGHGGGVGVWGGPPDRRTSSGSKDEQMEQILPERGGEDYDGPAAGAQVPRASAFTSSHVRGPLSEHTCAPAGEVK